MFLDRDGTLNEEIGYLDRMDRLALFPWTADAIRLLNRAGFCTVVTTNQSAVARGLIDEPFLRGVHDEIDARLARGGARIDRYFYCPHHPDRPWGPYRQACECRKPRPGMILGGGARPGPRPDAVGDGGRPAGWTWHAGRRPACGRCWCAPVVGAARSDAPGRGEEQPDAILNNLMEAVGWILRNSSRS